MKRKVSGRDYALRFVHDAKTCTAHVIGALVRVEDRESASDVSAELLSAHKNATELVTTIEEAMKGIIKK